MDFQSPMVGWSFWEDSQVHEKVKWESQALFWWTAQYYQIEAEDLDELLTPSHFFVRKKNIDSDEDFALSQPDLNRWRRHHTQSFLGQMEKPRGL